MDKRLEQRLHTRKYADLSFQKDGVDASSCEV
jgi:hypothetical protein